MGDFFEDIDMDDVLDTVKEVIDVVETVKDIFDFIFDDQQTYVIYSVV